MKTLRLLIVMVLAVFLTLCTSCANSAGGMRDGYYTAEASEFSEYGWKEFLTIYVSNNTIVTVEYDAYNASGFVRSWDINYMRAMNRTSSTYPNQFTREYSVALLNWQDADAVDAISGATDAHISFTMLAKAVIEQAKIGGTSVVLVDLSEANMNTES